MHTSLELNGWDVAKQPREDGLGYLALMGVDQRQADQGHIVAIDQRGEVLLLGRAQFFVSVQKEDPISSGRGDGGVAGGGEVVAPLEVTHMSAMLTGDFHGSIGGSRVDDDEFVGDVLHRGEALPQEALLVLDDHTDAQPGLPVGVR